MKNTLSLIILFFCYISSNGQTKFAGKTYVAEIGATCKDGVGMLYTSLILKFDKNTVTSSYKVTTDVARELKNGYEHMYDHLTKTYKWKIKNDILIIENCAEFSVLKIQKNKIIAQDNDSKTTLEFTEQTI